MTVFGLEMLSNTVYFDSMTQTNGAALRVIRRLSGLSLRALASRVAEQGVDVHPDSLSNIERGQRNASPALLKALACALKVPQVALLADLEQEAA
jgi:transcriptional regulator with XRE-family HTH domain